MRDERGQLRAEYGIGQIAYLEKIEEFCGYLHALWLDEKPLVKLFRTESNKYLYDTGTNRILGCNNAEFDMIGNLLKVDIREATNATASSYQPYEMVQAFEGIEAAIKEKNIMKTTGPISFDGAHFRNIEESIVNAVGTIQLEVTERCNLRCAYCLYNSHCKEKRNHGTRDMSLKTAFAALDHLARSSSQETDVGITFYGGEPLLCFPLIRACIEYGRSLFRAKNLGLSITTNATLITPDIARFLSEEGVGVHVSVDGPQDIHDQYRKDVNGNGSFQKAITGLETLCEAYGDKKDKITLSMVYTPPYSVAKLMRMTELWDQYRWLPRSIGLTISYALDFFLPTQGASNGNETDISLMQWAGRAFITDYQKGEKSHPMVSSIIEREMARIVKRPVYPVPLEKYCLNGCCLPGVRKQYVTVDGTLLMCERVGTAPAIGDVFNGVNVERLANLYVKEYSVRSLPQCSRCWALQLCPICYLHSFSQGRIDVHKKTNSCQLARNSISNMLALFCRLLEINASGLDYLGSWVFR